MLMMVMSSTHLHFDKVCAVKGKFSLSGGGRKRVLCIAHVFRYFFLGGERLRLNLFE